MAEIGQRIGEFWFYPQTGILAELLIDCEEDRAFGRCLSACCRRPNARSSGTPAPGEGRSRLV
jgi:hypothetical protein